MVDQNGFVYGVTVNSSSLLFAMAILSGFLVLAILVSMMRIYKKAGKPAISAIIPIWSQIVMFQIVDKPAWYVVLTFVPIVNIVVIFQAYILLAKKFGKGTGFGIGMIFLPMIFIPLLSFYDYVGNEEKKIEDNVYNPFNQTDVAQVMPSAPIGSENVNVNLEPVGITNVEIPQNENIVTQEGSESIPTNEAPIINEPPVPVIEPIAEQNAVQNSVVEEPVVNESVIPVIEPIAEQNVVQNSVVEESIQTNRENQNPTIQDLEAILNQKNVNEPKTIAFGSIPQEMVVSENESVQTEASGSLESLNIENKVLDTTVVSPENEVNINTNEVIEMPEIASKTCPACGVSLADDVKFCTSCGTQI